MNDEIQQPTPAPEPQPQLALPAPAPEESTDSSKALLDKLPPNIQTDIQEYYKQHNGISTRKYIQETYGDQYPQLKKIAKTTVYAYAKKHNLKTFKETILETEITNTSTEFENLARVSANPNATNQDIQSRIEDLIAYYNRVTAKLEAAQTNFNDPQLWANIGRFQADKLNALKELGKIREKVVQNQQKDINEEADIIFGLCSVAADNAYKMTSNYADFMNAYLVRVQDCFNNYRLVKEVLKENPVLR